MFLLKPSTWSLLFLRYHEHPWLQAMFTSVGWRDSQGACAEGNWNYSTQKHSLAALHYGENVGCVWWSSSCSDFWSEEDTARGSESKGDAFGLGSTTALELEQLPGSLLIILAGRTGFLHSAVVGLSPRFIVLCPKSLLIPPCHAVIIRLNLFPAQLPHEEILLIIHFLGIMCLKADRQTHALHKRTRQY